MGRRNRILECLHDRKGIDGRRHQCNCHLPGWGLHGYGILDGEMALLVIFVGLLARNEL